MGVKVEFSVYVRERVEPLRFGSKLEAYRYCSANDLTIVRFESGLPYHLNKRFRGLGKGYWRFVGGFDG